MPAGDTKDHLPSVALRTRSSFMLGKSQADYPGIREEIQILKNIQKEQGPLI